MTSLISSLIFVISANIDNILLGISLGMKKVNIPILKNIFISFLMCIITGFFMCSSNIVNIFFNTNILKFTGSLILILIGICGIISFYTLKKSNEDTRKYSKSLNFKELIYITIALASNNMAVGIIAGIAGINIIYTIIFTFFISFIFLYIGNKIGKTLLNGFVKKYAELLSSLLLIFLGISQILIK